MRFKNWYVFVANVIIIFEVCFYTGTINVICKGTFTDNREVNYDQFKHVSNSTDRGNPKPWRSCGHTQEQWLFMLSTPEKIKFGLLAVTSPHHIQADTQTPDNFMSNSLDFLLLS